MPNLVAELNSLDFSTYIGGPLQAAVQAQHAASMSQVNFIQEVGFEDVLNDDDEVVGSKLRYVDFSYTKLEPNPDYAPDADDDEDGDDDRKFNESKFTIKVPFLTMLTIPALRIDHMTIDFNAKLTSTQTANVSNSFAAKASLGIDYKFINFKASASYKRKSSRGTSTEKTYNLGVNVHAVNDELPAGLDRILTMLEDSITSMNA